MAKKGEKIRLKFDPRNARKHGKKNKEAAEKSLKELGAGRSVVADKDGYLVAGNLIYEKAKKLGLPIEEVHTNGDKLVVVVRDDLENDDPRRKALALADNQIGILGDWDEDVLAELAEEIDIDLEDLGFDDLEKADDEEIEPEIEFSPALMEEHNFIVLYFDNEVDWLAAQTHFGIKSVYAQRSNGKPWAKGVGRVIDGGKYLSEVNRGL